MPILTESINTPWKISNILLSWIVYIPARLNFVANGIAWGENWRFYGMPIVQKHRKSSMKFGSGLQLRSSIRSNPLGPNHRVLLSTWEAGAILEVGKNFAMSGGTICACNKILIGDNVAVGANTTIVDTDFHPLNAQERQVANSQAATAPVVIQNDVFIGMNCLILKGVTIGRGSVVGAGSVVTKDVPPCVIVAGNPARVLREI
jgi:acetyltransferase-like isoleucine patch superfamily enzyme